MAGILDKKQRFIDTEITAEGRRQIAAGELSIKYASFTDGHTFYVSGANSAAESAQERLYFEATSRLQDQIIVETDGFTQRTGVFVANEYDADGNLSGSLTMVGGKVYTTASMVMSGSLVISASENIASSSHNFFTQQYILGTRDIFDLSLEKKFEISFSLSAESPIGQNEMQVAHVNDLTPMLFDGRFDDLMTFKYLPPTFRESAKSPTDTSTLLGNYPDLNEPAFENFDDLLDSLVNYESATITFDETSRENNIIGQIFEASWDGVEKPDVLNFGAFISDTALEGVAQVFFVGKFNRDGNGQLTFSNIFTLVFE